MLNAPHYIRKLIGLTLLCLFAFSITPVIFLHNLVANHKDVSYSNTHFKGDQFSKAGINCRCISLVAEAQFINTGKPIALCLPEKMAQPRNLILEENFYSRHHFYAELRGPPSFL